MNNNAPLDDLFVVAGGPREECRAMIPHQTGMKQETETHIDGTVRAPPPRAPPPQLSGAV